MAATHVANKRSLSGSTLLPDLTAVSKRWKAMELPPVTDFDLRVKTSLKVLQQEQQEPTSVLDLQTSPGRSCSTSSASVTSSGDDSPHSVISNNSSAASFVQQAAEAGGIGNWMDALPEFEECGRNLEEVLKSDFDFDFELTSLDDADHPVTDQSCFPCFPSLLSEFLEEPLLLPESFHDAQRLQELDESLSSMLSGDVKPSGVPTTAELVKLVESCEDSRRGKLQGSSSSHHHSRSESWGSTGEVTTTTTTTAEPQEESGLQLVHLLLACAEAIEKSDYATAKSILSQLQRVSNPKGDPMQRIALYFGEALSDRLANNVAPPPRVDSKLAYQAFYKVLPFAKFSHITANQTIYEAVLEGSHDVHVIDLDIQQGLQWPCFIQSLAMRPGGAPNLRISAVGANASALLTTQRRLTEFAEALKVPFEFTPVISSLSSLSKKSFQIRHNEVLAINCSQVLHTLTGEALLLDNILALFRMLNPNVVTLLEVEANHNGASFPARFVEALHYYCALFDSLEGALMRDDADRFHIENTAFAAEIKDIVAFQGSSRCARHVRSETWRALFLKAGFRASPFSSYTIQQAQMLLEFLTKPNSVSMPYKLSEESNALILGWQDTPVMGVSAWSCC